MQLLFRLPFLLLEAVLRRGAAGLAATVRLVSRDRGEDVEAMEAEPFPGVDDVEPAFEPSAPAGPPPPTAEEALERRFAREARVTPIMREPPEPAPLRADGAPQGHVDREATVVESIGPAEDVRGTMTVDPPWPDYDALPASAIVGRLRDADAATRGVVRLYEQGHKRRATILRAAG